MGLALHMTSPLSTMLGLGLFGVGGLAFTEKILPLPPSHVLLLFLGMTAATDGWALAILLAVTAAGSAAGAMFWYVMGRRLGTARADALAERFGKYVFLRYATYRSLADAYRRNHFRASLIAQLIPTVRNYLPVAAGALQLPVLPFASATLLGILLWNVGFLLAGHLMREAGQDPADIGFRIMVVVLLVEVTLLLALRLAASGRLRLPKLAARMIRKRR